MTSSPRATAAPSAPREHGLTLIEMVVALLVFGILMAGVAELVVNSSRNAGATGSLAAIEDTGRTAQQIISAGIRRAGYLGGNIDISNKEDLIGGTLGDSTIAATCVAADTTWATMVGQPIFGLNDTVTGYACMTAGTAATNYLRGDVLTVRYTPSPAVTGALVATRPYLRASLVDGKIFLGANTASSANTMSDPAARVYELTANSFYVGATGRRCQDEEIPALFRKAIDVNGRPASEELLAGVEHLQFRYLVGNRYYSANAVPSWLGVDAVETTILVRAECPEGAFENTRDFAMGDLGTAYGPNDGLRRQVFTSTTSLRN